MARTSKLTPDITRQIGDNIALGLTHALAAAPSGITYKPLTIGCKKAKLRHLEIILSFINISTNATQKEHERFCRA